jgi:hypothetical protein
MVSVHWNLRRSLRSANTECSQKRYAAWRFTVADGVGQRILAPRGVDCRQCAFAAVRSCTRRQEDLLERDGFFPVAFAESALYSPL